MKAPVGIDAWWIRDCNSFHIGFDIGIICRYHIYRLAITQVNFTKGIKMGMSMHDKYYEPEDDDTDSEELQYEISELMKDDCNPCNYHNFVEAFSAVQKKEIIEQLEEMLEKRDFEALGRKLWNLSYEYYEQLATDRVLGI